MVFQAPPPTFPVPPAPEELRGGGGCPWCDVLLVLQVMTDVEDKNEWKNCIDIAGVQLPTGYFFGASAGTGDLSGEGRLCLQACLEPGS